MTGPEISSIWSSYVISKSNLDTYLGDLSLATFFSRYYTEIERACLQYEKETGTPVVIQGDTMLFLSTLALSILALEIVQECGFEIKKHNGSYTLK